MEHRPPSSNLSHPAWRDFEEAVAAIQALLSPGAEVQHNVYINDFTGARRQFDVVVRGDWCGFQALGVLECKHMSRPVGVSEVEAFHAKSTSVRANFRAIVSRAGFSRDALELARYYDVGALSLLEGTSSVGFSIGDQFYARTYKWLNIRMNLHFPKNLKRPLKSFDPVSVVHRGQVIVDWFRKELSTKYLRRILPGPISCQLRFDRPFSVQVGRLNRLVSGIDFFAERKIVTKTKFVRWSGQVVYNWHDKKLHWPHGASVTPDIEFRGDLQDWSPFDGQIPDSDPTFMRVILHLYESAIDPAAPTINLEEL